MVKGPGVRGEGRGDLGVRFDRLNELRGRRGRSLSLWSLSLSKGRKAGGGGSVGVRDPLVWSSPRGRDAQTWLVLF